MGRIVEIQEGIEVEQLSERVGEVDQFYEDDSHVAAVAERFRG